MEEPVIIHEPEYDPNGPLPPPFGEPDSIWIFWDGRVNLGENEDHLGDPHQDPYSAKVQVFEDNNPVMESNSEDFNIVPFLDSVAITHEFWYPPVDYGWFTTLFSVARARIDDTGEAASDHRFFVPNNAQYPPNLTLWNGEAMVFRDAQPNNSPVFYYEKIEEPFLAGEWDEEHWGTLTYQWHTVKDTVNYNNRENVQYYDVDTTDWWGTDWAQTIVNDVNWRVYRGFPYMRILIRSGISGLINGYEIQQIMSAEGPDAHKVMYSNSYWGQHDLLNWAISQIGTPYYSILGVPKEPYLRIDCSGLVTASRIQQVGDPDQVNYRINYMNVQSFADGYYEYPPGSGNHVPTGTSYIDASEASRGCLVMVRMPNTSNFGHIAIVEYIRYDYDRQIITHCYIVHAKGRRTAEQRRVKFDNLLGSYPGWDYQFLSFSAP